MLFLFFLDFSNFNDAFLCQFMNPIGNLFGNLFGEILRYTSNLNINIMQFNTHSSKIDILCVLIQISDDQDIKIV